MGKLMGIEQLFEGRHFDCEVIILRARRYLRFKLSQRDLVEMMANAACRWPIRSLCVGCGDTHRSSRSESRWLAARRDEAAVVEVLEQPDRAGA
jgi:hypothetical protein